MRLVTYDRGGQRRLGAILEAEVVDLPDAVGHPAFPTTLEGLVSSSRGTVMDAAREAMERDDVWSCHVPHPALLTPVFPASLRSPTALELDRRLVGPDDVVPWPAGAAWLDYEPMVAAVLGREAPLRVQPRAEVGRGPGAEGAAAGHLEGAAEHAHAQPLLALDRRRDSGAGGVAQHGAPRPGGGPRRGGAHGRPDEQRRPRRRRDPPRLAEREGAQAEDREGGGTGECGARHQIRGAHAPALPLHELDDSHGTGRLVTA
jgi:hypothetical protein